MPDHTPLRDWNAAFASLPLERPDGDGWAELARRLPERNQRNRWPALLALAAAVALAVVVPLRMFGPDNAAPAVATNASPTTQPSNAIDPLEQLYAQSAQLEALLEMARDDRVATGAAVEVAADLESELARIDAQLRQPGLARDRQLALWRARVDTLGTMAEFEGTRRWLAVHGEGYDGAIVQVD